MYKFIKKYLKKLWVAVGAILLAPQLVFFINPSDPSIPLVLKLLAEHYYILNLTGLFCGLIATFFSFYIPYKEHKAKKLISEVIVDDSIWDFESLKINSRSIFYKLQYAISNKNIIDIQPCLTSNCVNYLKLFIENIASNNFQISSIDVSETRIICCQDYIENANDMYVAYLSGMIKAFENQELYFSQMLFFKRYENDWLLDKFDQTVTLLDLIRQQNLHQE